MLKYLYYQDIFYYYFHLFVFGGVEMATRDYEEKKQRGSLSFPIDYYYIDSSHPRYVMQLHWHGEFEILRILSGELHVFLNNTRYTAHPGDLIFISSLMLHRAEPYNCDYECIVFDMNMVCGHGCDRVAELLGPITSGRVEPVKFVPHCDDELSRCTNSLFSLLREHKPFYELAVCAAIDSMFFHLMRRGVTSLPFPERIGHKKKTIALVVDWIERNYQEKITLGKLAKISGLNEKYLCRVFREFTGQSPTEYINRLRIERACFEMSINSKSVTDAALDCGFNDLSYFSRTFKKYKGQLPREFCRRISKGDNQYA